VIDTTGNNPIVFKVKLPKYGVSLGNENLESQFWALLDCRISGRESFKIFQEALFFRALKDFGDF